MSEEEVKDLKSYWMCPYESPKGCEWVGTYRCTAECDFHPENYHMGAEILKHFKAEPWAIYCLSCGEFLDSRFGHPEKHIIATGIREYREKLPDFVLERMRSKEIYE